jgi:trehalose 6-phosphate phosphatase
VQRIVPYDDPANLPVAEAPLFFLDYDGTLAPIVDDPAAAHPHDAVPALLETLDAAHPLWIVTGRDAHAVERFLNLPLRVVGLHGAQEGVLHGEVERLMTDAAAAALDRLRAEVPAIEGLSVEEKDAAFALHYRQAPDKDAARERLAAWTDEAVPDGLEAIWGKDVMELRPEGLDKGAAVRRLAEGFPERTPVYLGDDVTDEDAFAALEALRRDAGRDAITVRVGKGETRARHRLEGPDAVVAYLRRYA